MSFFLNQAQCRDLNEKLRVSEEELSTAQMERDRLKATLTGLQEREVDRESTRETEIEAENQREKERDREREMEKQRQVKKLK